MLTGEIKIHEEPVGYTTYSSGSQSNYLLMTMAEKEAFCTRHQEVLEKAKALISVGDTFILDYSQNQVLKKVVGFIEAPAEVITYQQNLCVILATNAEPPIHAPMKYSIEELNLDSIVHVEKLVLLGEASDEIPV